MTVLFPIPELLMLALFVAGLLWLIVELAVKDLKSLRRMLSDTEAFARDPAARPGFRVSRLRPARVLDLLHTKFATIRPTRKS